MNASTSTPADEETLLRLERERYDAMINKDTERLNQLLAEDFALVHITGYRQSKAEWLEQITSGEMAYHKVEEVSADVTITGDKATIVTRNHVTATIYGSRNTWPLESTTTYERRNGTWVPTSSQATTFR